MPIDRDVFFERVRPDLFSGSLNQDQVDGLNALLDYWEENWETDDSPDLRLLAYPLATTHHETGRTMQPIEEWGKGDGKSYGEEDPETGQQYFGRGYVQLTWRENYERATQELNLEGDDDLEWHAEQALEPDIAAAVLFEGSKAGWFTGKQLSDYFNETEDDPLNARQIINGNDCDELIAGYHADYLAALKAAYTEEKAPAPVAMAQVAVQVVLRVPRGTRVEVIGATLVTAEEA